MIVHMRLEAADGLVLERDVEATVRPKTMAGINQPGGGMGAETMPLIYDNSIIDSPTSFLPTPPDVERLDFGTSDGAIVSKFEIGYGANLPALGPLEVRFYSGTSATVCPGTPLVLITITGLSGNTVQNVEIDLAVQGDSFALPAGEFGYSYKFDPNDANDAGPRPARGGSGNIDLYYRDCEPYQITGSQHAGLYMKIYGGGNAEPNLRVDPNELVFSCLGVDPNEPCDPNLLCDPNAPCDPNALCDPNMPCDPNTPCDPNQLFSYGDDMTSLAMSLAPEDKLFGVGEIERQLIMSGRAKVIVMLEDPVAHRIKVKWRSPHRKSSRMLKAFHAEVQRREENVIHRANPAECAIGYRFNNIAGFSADVTAAGIAHLQHDPRVVSIEPDEELQLHTLQGIALMSAQIPPLAYDGTGVAVAIVDSGVDYTHPQLGGGGFPNSKVIGGFDYYNNDANPFPDLTTDGAHGTCTAGIAAGDVPPGGAVGDFIGGVAPGAKIYALKACGATGSCNSSAIDNSWDWCIDHQLDDPSNPIMVISNSFGGGQFFASCDASMPSRAALADAAAAAGITVLASAGNEGYCDSIAQPACLSSVISVGAVYDANIGSRDWCVSNASCAASAVPCGIGDRFGYDNSTAADQVTAYSNSADFLDIFAPSNDASTSDIVGASGYDSGNYTNNFGGTSAACPYAAGAVAVLQSAALAENGFFLTPEQVRQALIDTGDPVTDPKAPTITKPRVNLQNAVTSAICGGQFLTIHNDGNGTLHISDILDPNWITINPTGPMEIPANSQRKICVEADCSVCGFNEITDVITFLSDDPNEPVMDFPVTLICPDCNVPSDLDGDCDGDYADFAAFTARWLDMFCVEPDFCGGADINQDGKVDPLDAVLLAMYWLEGTGSP